MSLGFSKRLENLEAIVAHVVAYDNFVWRTHDVAAKKTRLPAAMDSLMSFEGLFDAVTGGGWAMAA